MDPEVSLLRMYMSSLEVSPVAGVEDGVPQRIISRCISRTKEMNRARGSRHGPSRCRAAIAVALCVAPPDPGQRCSSSHRSLQRARTAATMPPRRRAHDEMSARDLLAAAERYCVKQAPGPVAAGSPS